MTPLVINSTNHHRS